MALPVSLPCPYHYRHLVFPRAFHRWPQLAVRPRAQVVRLPQNKGWSSDHHPRRSDHLALRGSFVTNFADFHRAPRDTHDPTRAKRDPDVHDSARASRGSEVPALLTSPLGCVGATSIASTSVVATGEGRTSVTSSQPSSDDHVGEARLTATGHQTHIVNHLDIIALSSAHLRPCRPHRPVLALCRGGRI
jgi:hypothetical protein